MAGPNVGNITPRANVCSCTCTREGFCTCDCFQTNEIGVRRMAMTVTDDDDTQG